MIYSVSKLREKEEKSEKSRKKEEKIKQKKDEIKSKPSPSKPGKLDKKLAQKSLFSDESANQSIDTDSDVSMKR